MFEFLIQLTIALISLYILHSIFHYIIYGVQTNSHSSPTVEVAVISITLGISCRSFLSSLKRNGTAKQYTSFEKICEDIEKIEPLGAYDVELQLDDFRELLINTGTGEQIVEFDIIHSRFKILAEHLF